MSERRNIRLSCWLRLALPLTGALAAAAPAAPRVTARPDKVVFRNARLLPSGGLLTLPGDGSARAEVHPDFTTLRKSRANLSQLQAGVLHWGSLGVTGPTRSAAIVFYRLLKSNPSRQPKPRVDFDPTPVLTANLSSVLEKDGEIRISGFATAVKNWVSGQWEDRGMLVAVVSRQKAETRVILSPTSGIGVQPPYFELRWNGS